MNADATATTMAAAAALADASRSGDECWRDSDHHQPPPPPRQPVGAEMNADDDRMYGRLGAM